MYKEIKKYDYRIVPQCTTVQEPYFAQMFLYDATNVTIAQLNFITSKLFTSIPPASIDSYGKVIMYFREEEFLSIMDMLRNEKPLYLWGRETAPTWFVLTTEQEPI